MPHKSHPKRNSNGEAKSLNKSKLVDGHHTNPPSDIDFDISVANCPPTQRVPAIHADEYIEKPGIARGNLAASTDSPHGDEEYSSKYRKFVSSPLCPRPVKKRQEFDREQRPHCNNTFSSGTAMQTARSTPGTHISASVN